MPPTLSFEKYEGLGNDFIVVESEVERLSTARAVALCDRHFGVGADGILFVGAARTAGARASMTVINADGSRPEMCGNGLRCVGLYLARRDGLERADYLIDTDAGPKSASMVRAGDAATVTLGMGHGEIMGEYLTTFAGRAQRFMRVSMGNPHAIVFDAGFDERAMDELGPQVSAAIEGGSNVESVTARDSKNFDVLVWERGVGRTLACGTGAAAAAVALVVGERAASGEVLSLHLPGGLLELSVERDSLEVTLRGPARRVFAGQVIVE